MQDMHRLHWHLPENDLNLERVRNVRAMPKDWQGPWVGTSTFYNKIDSSGQLQNNNMQTKATEARALLNFLNNVTGVPTETKNMLLEKALKNLLNSIPDTSNNKPTFKTLPNYVGLGSSDIQET